MAEGGGGSKTLVIVLVVLLIGGVCVCGGGAVGGYYFWVEAKRRAAVEQEIMAAEMARAEAEYAARVEQQRALEEELARAEAEAPAEPEPEAEMPDPEPPAEDAPSPARRTLRALAPGADAETLVAAQVIVAQRLGLAGIDGGVAVEGEGLTVEVAEASYFDAMPLLTVPGRLRLQLVVTPIDMPEDEIAATIDYVRRRQQSGEWDPSADAHDVALSRQGPVLLEAGGLEAPRVVSAEVGDGSVGLRLDEPARASLAGLGLAGRSLAIRFDELVVHVAAFDEPFEGDVLRLSGLDPDEARKIAVLARAGPLPVALALQDD